ncbi:cell surface A33 antigen [Candoia aspera]|uniref:cell surface A33 antigen n=1 Tax=Candoia aspera TaxID=51853 RepID=UPI002FD8699D
MKAKEGVPLLIISAVVAAVHALSVLGPSKAVKVERGYNATLPCNFKSNAVPEKTDSVFWRGRYLGSSHMEEFARKKFSGTEFYAKPYEGRLRFSPSLENGDAGITFNEVIMDDNGTYECIVEITHDYPSRSAYIELFVLVSPSEPECNILGTPEYGRNINLTCNSDEGSPKPQYTWQSYNTQNENRPLQGTTIGGVLMLNNISADTTGYYICISKNTVGEATCNITVAVRPPSMNGALYAGVIGGVFAAVIIISVLVYCCCCRKSKNKDYEATETENKFQPQHEIVRIRGPSKEEIQDEGKELQM